MTQTARFTYPETNVQSRADRWKGQDPPLLRPSLHAPLAQGVCPRPLDEPEKTFDATIRSRVVEHSPQESQQRGRRAAWISGRSELETVLQEVNLLIIIINYDYYSVERWWSNSDESKQVLSSRGSWGTCFHGYNNHFNWRINYT